MKRFQLIIIVSAALTSGLISNASHAEIFRSVQPDGTVVYSDQPNGNAKAVDLPPLMITPSTQAQNPPPQGDTEKQAVQRRISISSPTANSIIPNGLNPTTVSTQTSPALGKQDRIRILLDNRLVAYGNQNRYVIQQLPRGQHQLQAQWVDKEGKLLAQSSNVSIQVYWPGN